ncbi:MAG: hypothetical protein V1882_11820 [Candidatus Omnitrophota bacterium]
MISPDSIVGIYDFELFPYALGDVLTWNIQTAIDCDDLGREKVDICICLDERNPVSIFQRDMINRDNFSLFFSELYSAFSTHPRLGNIHIFHRREDMVAYLNEVVAGDPVNSQIVVEYMEVLNHFKLGKIKNIANSIFLNLRKNPVLHRVYKMICPTKIKKTIFSKCQGYDAKEITDYFAKYIQSHESINEYASRKGCIPFLRPGLGCAPDIDELISTRLKRKKIVSFHLRLRQLDAGYGGEYSYERDSDFLEWYDFLTEAGKRYPDVMFVSLGRLPEKPLELLRLPNVLNLRVFGMGLGHELTMMLKSDLFLGTSSGFAACANFSRIPYFITKMSSMSCQAYCIPDRAERLPFATKDQVLIYERETLELLMGLLEKGLKLASPKKNPSRDNGPAVPSEVDVKGWAREHFSFVNSTATTCRFFVTEKYRDEETAFLLFPYIERIKAAVLEDRTSEARGILDRFEKLFPVLCSQFPQYLLLKALTAVRDRDSALAGDCLKALDSCGGDHDAAHLTGLLKSCLADSSGDAHWPELASVLKHSAFFTSPK